MKRTKLIPLEIEALKAEYAKSRALQLEFDSEKVYLGFCSMVFSQESCRRKAAELITTHCKALAGITMQRDEEAEGRDYSPQQNAFVRTEANPEATRLQAQIKKNQATIKRLQGTA